MGYGSEALKQLTELFNKKLETKDSPNLNGDKVYNFADNSDKVHNKNKSDSPKTASEDVPLLVSVGDLFFGN